MCNRNYEEKKIKKDAIANNENNKAVIFRSFGKSNYFNANNHNDALGLLIDLNIYHVTERQGEPKWLKVDVFRLSYLVITLNSL